MALENLKRIMKIAEAFDKKSLTQDDFLKAFKTVVDVVVKIRKDVNEAIAKMGDTHNTLTERERGDRDNNFNTLRGQVNDVFVGDQIKRIGDEQGASFENLKTTINNIVDEKMVDVDERMSRVRSIKGDKGKRGEQGSKDNGREIRNKLESLEGEDRLDFESIKGLPEILEKIEKKIPTGGIITGRYVHTPMVDVFTGDASTKAFTLSKAPKDLATVKGWGSDFPYILVEGSDNGFTINGKVLTLNDVVDAPSLNARFVIEYYT